LKKAIEIEAIIDERGNVLLLETAKLPGPRRARVTIFENEPAQLNLESLEVRFIHPSPGMTLTADVSPLCTGREAISSLLEEGEESPFLSPIMNDGGGYELMIRRTGVFIHPEMTFALAGVVTGDEIQVSRYATGAGPNLWDTIQLTFAYGIAAGTGLAFLKAVTPIITQLLENKAKRIVRIRWGDKEFELQGGDIGKTIRELRKATDYFKLSSLEGEAQVPPRLSKRSKGPKKPTKTDTTQLTRRESRKKVTRAKKGSLRKRDAKR